MTPTDRTKLADGLLPLIIPALKQAASGGAIGLADYELREIAQDLATEIVALRAPEAADAGAVEDGHCPFCGRDPFHRSDMGEPLAVDCCDLGDALFRGARATPEMVTIEWDDFVKIANRLRASPTAAGIAAPPDVALLQAALKLTPQEQFSLAASLANNVGYDLVEERQHPDSPHATPPAASADAVRALDSLLRAVEQCDSYANPDSGLASKVAAYRSAALTQPVAGDDAGMRERAAKVADAVVASEKDCYVQAGRDNALSETGRERIEDQLSASIRTAAGIAAAIRALPLSPDATRS